MRDHCNCGRPFALGERVGSPTAYHQTYSDDEGTVVQQAVNCPSCKTSLVAAEVEIVCGVYGPEDKVCDAWQLSFDAFMRGSYRPWNPDPWTIVLGVS